MRRLFAAAFGAALLFPAVAQATVTIGSDLARPIDTEIDCAETSCTLAQSGLASSARASGGVASPVNGTVVRWRIRTGPLTNVTALRVIRPLAGGLFTAAGTSSTVTPAANSVTTTPTQLSIAAGDRLGLDVPGAPLDYSVANTGTMDTFKPLLVSGGPGRAPLGSAAREIALNADVEPYNAFDVVRRRSKRGGKVVVTLSLPNPGLVRITGVKKAKTHLRPRTVEVEAGIVRVKLKPNKAGIASLGNVDRLETNATIRFTPTGGLTNGRVVSLRLRS